MSKHIYMGTQRIVSKLCDAGTMADPTTATKATYTGSTLKYADKYTALTATVKARYDSLGVAYNGVDNKGATFYKASPGGGLEGLYYYHSDQLGSANYITDANGDVAQHLEYIPYGETFVDERYNNWHSPYLFSGKERDEETSLTYYGARYFDGKGWLSVDPLAHKYPNVSSYVYCMANPVKYVDPDGREIWIVFDVTNKDGSTTQQKVQYKDGKLFGTDGKAYTGGNEYATKIMDDLNQLAKDNTDLSDRITTLQDSKNIHTIKMTANPDDGNANTPISQSDDEKGISTGSNTTYNPDKETNARGYKRAPRAGLAHELLGHGWDSDQGKADYNKTENGIPMYEVNAVNMENRARAAAGNEKKTTYAGKPIPEKLLDDTHKKKE